jgi:hypothetical protein
MSFLNSDSTMFISARLTNIGKKLIAKGNFLIKYFQIGDSEYDYSNDTIKTQKVFSSFDFENGVKYPYKSFDNKNFGETTEESQTKTVRNVVQPIGIISDYKKFDENNGDGIFVNSYSEISDFTKLNGTNEIEVVKPSNFIKNEIITIIFSDFGGMDSNVSMITKKANSVSYKILDIIENKLLLDRNLPNLSNLKGHIRILLNLPSDKNTWKCSIVSDNSEFISIKEFLGYTSNESQIFFDDNGKEIEYPTSFVNSFNDKILVSPNEQKEIAILHISDIKNRYGSYISYDAKTIKSKLAYNNNGDLISDTEYFEIYIPYIFYHKNTSDIPGAIFKMGKNNFYLKSDKNEHFKLMYRYLIDEKGNKVGKVFPHKQIIVFDDQEIVNVLNYKTNRKYTLPSPKVTTSPTSNSFFNFKEQIVWVTYMLRNEKNNSLNGAPCGYINKVISDYDVNINLEFGKDTFTNMKINIEEIKNGFVADKIFVLLQITDKDKIPNKNNWKIVNLTTQIENHNQSQNIKPEDLTNQKFIIDKIMYEDSEEFIVDDYSLNEDIIFPGNVKLVMASDIEEMRILINTPHHNFNETQNPTYQEGQQKKVTEIALLNEEKETLVMAKMAVPVSRNGSQTFVVKLDF